MTLPHPLSQAGLDLTNAERSPGGWGLERAEKTLAYHCSVSLEATASQRLEIFMALTPETIAADIRGMGVDRAGALLYATRNGDTLEESAAVVGALLAIYDAGIRPLLLTS